MRLYLLFIFMIFKTGAGDVGVEGEISINLKDPSIPIPYQKPIKKQQADPIDGILEIANPELKVISNEDHVVRGFENGQMTVAPVLECMYQIPEESQVQALLSNMMNELTKMFVRAHDFINGNFRRKGATRFSVITKKQTEFFDDIYSNMTKQYLTLYNSTAVRVDRSGRQKDPCENQEEIKELWKDLLDSSLVTFRQAALKCIDEHLKSKGKGKDSKVRLRMSNYLLKEMGKIKMSQLAMLCDKFQLCFNELLRRHDKSNK